MKISYFQEKDKFTEPPELERWAPISISSSHVELFDSLPNLPTYLVNDINGLFFAQVFTGDGDAF